MEESWPGSAIWSLKKLQGAAGCSPPLEPTSTAPLQIQPRHPRAAQAHFLGPQAQVSPLAEQPSWPPPKPYQSREEQESLLLSHMMEGQRHFCQTLLCSYIALEKPKSCPITTLSAYAQGCHVICRGGVLSNIFSCNHTVLWLGTGALGKEDLQHYPAGEPGDWEVALSSTALLSSTRASLLVSLPGVEQWPPKTCGAGLKG